MQRFIKASQIMTELQISRGTLKLWKDKGLIAYKKLSDKKYLYDINSVLKEGSVQENRLNVIYARVSTSRQVEDLNRQLCILKEYCLKQGVKIDKVFADVGSGLNADRKEFNELLALVFERKVKKIYISFKDRLTRFGFNYIKNICEYFDTEIEVLDDDEFRNSNNEKELTEDLIAIIHHYSMKVYNSRRKKFKQIKAELENE